MRGTPASRGQSFIARDHRYVYLGGSVIALVGLSLWYSAPSPYSFIPAGSVPGTAREIAAIFTAVAIGLAMGMGMLGVAVVFFLLAAAAVLALTKLHFGAMPENAKVLRITVPEDVDYESALPDVFRAHHVTATLEKVRTESMGTLFELTYQVNLPSAVPSKALLDDLRERNGNLPILFTNPGDKDSL